MDEDVVRSHIVSGQVLFTRPRRLRAEPVKTVQHDPRMSVMVKMIGEAEDSVVQSITVKGNTRHNRGVVSARVVMGDIVTPAGVIHLIDTPLVLMPQTLAQMVAEKPGLAEKMPGLSAQLESAANMTLLLPSNAALSEMEEADVRLHLLPTLVLESSFLAMNESSVSVMGSNTKDGSHLIISSLFKSCPHILTLDSFISGEILRHRDLLWRSEAPERRLSGSRSRVTGSSSPLTASSGKLSRPWGTGLATNCLQGKHH